MNPGERLFKIRMQLPPEHKAVILECAEQVLNANRAGPQPLAQALGCASGVNNTREVQP